MQRDWTRDEDYADIPQLDDGGLAWEFLRRNPDYVRDFAAGEPVGRWGLAAPADPERSALEARPLWRWDFAPSVVVRLTGSPPTARDDGLVMHELRDEAAEARLGAGGLQLRFSNGLQALVEAGTEEGERLAVVIPLDGDFLARATAARLLRSGMTGGWRRISALSAPRRARLALTARALDAREARASYREIAHGLLREPPRASLDWRTSTARAFVIRLCSVGRNLARGGYLGLLRGRAAAVARVGSSG